MRILWAGHTTIAREVHHDYSAREHGGSETCCSPKDCKRKGTGVLGVRHKFLIILEMEVYIVDNLEL